MADFGANVLASSVALIILLAVMGLVYYFWLWVSERWQDFTSNWKANYRM